MRIDAMLSMPPLMLLVEGLIVALGAVLVISRIRAWFRQKKNQ
jgi:hypothetical protein